MSSSILKYGQIIRFCSYEAAMANPKVNNTFITSKSYTDQNLYFQVYNIEDVYYKDTSSETLNIHNYRQSLFQVLPTSSFEINDEMNDKGEKKELQRAKTEEEQFKTMISEKRGKYIYFGDRVVLKHVDSQYYISGSIDCAPSGIGAFKIKLRKQLSQKNVFQLMSYRTYEKEGDEISINAPFRIYHCETQCYVSYCFENLFVDKKFFDKNDLLNRDFLEQFVKYPAIKNSHFISDANNAKGHEKEDEKEADPSVITFPTSGRFEIINENIPKRVFKMVLHNEFEMKPVKQAIKNHDVVYFIHTKDDKYLCCSNFERQSKSDIFLKKRKNETDLSHIFDGLWQIEQIKAFEEKYDQGLGKTRSPNPKKNHLVLSTNPQIHIQGPKGSGGGLLTVADRAFLAQTLNPHLQTGALGVGMIMDDEETTTKSKTPKKKYIIRHLISGRIMFITQNLKVKVECPENQKFQKTVLLESVDSNFADGALVQFAHKAAGQDEKGKQKIVKYFLQIDEQQKKETKQQKNGLNYTEQIEEERSEYQNKSSEMGTQQIDEIDLTYNSFFQINQLKMTVDSSQHGFRIYKIEEQIKQLAHFVLSSQQIMYKFCGSMSRLRFFQIEKSSRQRESDDANKMQFNDDTNVAVLNNVINVLKDLIGFIYDCDYSMIAESGNNPNQKKQRIFDELGMIQLLTRMVEIIDTYDLNLQKLVPADRSEYKKVRYIYVLAYNLLESIAANNYVQKIKISKYLEKYLNQLKKQQNKVVYRSIQEVLDGNYLALQKRVTAQYIDELIKKFQVENPDPADLYFLSRLCLCGDKTVTQNQNAVYSSFYQTNEGKKVGYEEETVADNKFKFREDQGKMQILSKIANFPPQYRTLSELYDECILLASDEGSSSISEKGHWNYFLQYLNLLADVCVDRNSIALQYIIDNLPLKTLVAFLHDTTVKKKLLFQPFIRLVHHAFVQTKKYEGISRITKVKQWNLLGDFEIPKSKNYKSIEADIDRTMQLIMEYIRRINKRQFSLPFNKEQQQKMKNKISILDRSNQKQPDTIDFDPQNKERLYNVKTFLQILKSTLNLGFWPSMQRMQHMVPYMLKVMKFDYQYAQKKLILAGQSAQKDKIYQLVKQQLTLNKPNIVLMVECKILAAEILNIIIDYEYNVRVSIITKYFKDVMENDVDLSKYKYDAVEFTKKWRSNQEFELIEPANDKEGYLLDQQLWKDKVSQIIAERNIFKFCESENINESLSMFETFIYENEQLTNMTFEILKRITNERREILKTFKDIIFVAGGNLSSLAERGVGVARSVLLRLTNVAVKKVKVSTASNYLWQVVRSDSRQAILNRLKPLGAIQQLAFLTMAMIKNGNPTLERASLFYKNHQLYPFKQLIGGYDDFNHFQDGSYLVITEKDENIPLNQNLIKSQDHHNLIIQFIKIMSDIKEDDKDDSSPLPRRALHAAYNFLTVLVWNHNENKKELEDLLRISECHLKFNVGAIDFYKEMYKNNMKLVKKSEIMHIVHHIIDLTNNTDIKLYQKSKLLDFLRVIVIFDDEGYDVNQNIVMQIISQYQVSSKNQIVILKTEDELSNRIKLSYDRWIQEYQEHYFRSTRKYEDLNLSPQLFYLATFFEIFCALIENENVVNIGKCTNMHPLSFLLDLLGGARNCWPLIRHLRAYVNKLYYFSGREKDTAIFDLFIVKDLPNIRNEMRGIVELVCNTPDYNIIKIKNPIRYAYIGSYVYLTLEEILHSLDLMFQLESKEFRSHYSMLIGQTTLNDMKHAHTLIEIIEMNEYLQKTIEGRSINKYLEKVSKLLKFFLQNIHLTIVEKFQQKSKIQMADNMKENSFGGDDVPFKKNYIFHQEKGLWRHLIDWNSFKEQDSRRQRLMDSIQKGIIKDPAESKEAELQKKRDYNLELIFLGNIEKKIQKVKAEKPVSETEAADEVKNEQKPLMQANLPRNLTTSMSNRFKVKNERFQNNEFKNTTINSRRKKLVKFIQINQEFTKFADQQTQAKLYEVFAQLNRLSQEKYASLVVGNADVIKAIVKMNEKDPNFLKPEYKLMVVELLTNYIQRQAAEVFRENIQDWEVAGEQRENINKAQNFLSECGCAKYLCSLIINDLRKDIKMGNSILKFGICLLLGQNKDNQSAIFDILKRDDQNILIIELQNLIKSCGTSIATHVLGKTQKSFSSNRNYSDTYDFYDDLDKSMTRKFIYVPETVEEQKEFDLKLIALQETFIFLRVLCEGNNEIKNFIREQKTNDEEKKVKNESVNFISLGVYEIKRMFLNFNINNVKVPFSIINFIIEVTQIPCISNQLFLCESSYFHDFANLEMEIEKQLKSEANPANREKWIAATRENVGVINKLYSLCVNNVISCLEGNRRKIYNFLSSEDLSRFFVKCLSFYVKYLPLLEDKLGLPEIKEGKELQGVLAGNRLHENYFLDLFHVTSVINKLMQKLNGNYKKQFEEGITWNLKLTNIRDHFELIRKNLLGIEIAMDEYEAEAQDNGEDRSEERNQILFFPRHAVYSYLSRSTRARIMTEINRSTQRDKIIGLFMTTHEISEQINYNYELDNEYTVGNVPVSISNNKITFYQNLGMYIATFICFLMMIFSTVVYYPYEHSIEYDMGPETFLFRIISLVQFVVAIVFFLLFLKSHLKLAIGKYHKQREAEEQEGVGLSTLLKLAFKIPFAKELYCLMNFDQQFTSVCMYMTGSFLGCFYKTECFSILLFNLMLQKIDVLKSILIAITTNMKMLGMLSLLGMAFISIFSIFSIHYYASSLYPQKIPKDHCQSLFNCIIELYIREQIGEDMESFELGRFISDMVYTIFMDMLFGNIVGGVLIDTFAELRQKGDEIEQDKKGKCFICGIEKETLEKTNQDLKTHYQSKYHKLWNYVFYIHYLNQKTKKTGLEIIIEEKIQSENVSWIPNSSSDTADIGQKIDQLERLITEQQEMVKKIEASE